MKLEASKTRTPKQVRDEFARAGVNITQWALAHGYSPALVYLALRGDRQPKRGQLYEICVHLGLIRPTELSERLQPKRRAA